MKTISPFRFNHEIQANASKSDAQRCLILAAFSSGPTALHGLDESEDIVSMQKCLRVLGAEHHGTNPIYIQPRIQQGEKSVELQVGESGFALRTLAFMSLIDYNDVTILGKGTLLKREQHQLIEILNQLGLQVESNDGKLPLRVQGTISVSELSVDGSAGSQVISGLCLLAPHLPNGLKISVANLTSKPYLEMTLERMKFMGIHVQSFGKDSYFIPGKQTYHRHECHIEGDWSGAANLIVGAAISGNIRVSGLASTSLQADKRILEFVQAFGAQVKWSDANLSISAGTERRAFIANIEDCPDIFPILVILACAADGTSAISGIHRLKNKESDRLSVMCELLKSVGVSFEIESNTISIHGTGKIEGGTVDTHNDHRIAMAAAIAACISRNEISLTDENCVSKSYPTFFRDLGI